VLPEERKIIVKLKRCRSCLWARWE